VREAQQDGIGIGIVGCGLVTQTMHLPHLLDDSAARVRWLCDRDPARLSLAAARAPSARTCAEPAQVLEADVDAVLIATHDLDHPALVLDALAAGKHVFVEKPLALCAADAEAVAERARASGLYVAVGYQRMHDPALPRLAELLGGLGQVGLVHMHDVCHDNDLLVRELVGDSLGGESFARGRTDYGDEGAWRELAARVFGELPEPLLATYRLVHNLACHDLSVLIALLGEPLAVEHADFWPAHYGIVVWRFAEAKCVLEIGQTDRKWFDQRLIAYGSEATLEASWPSPFLTGAPTTVELRRMRGAVEEETTERLSHRSSFRAELRDFLDRLEHGRFDDRSVAQAASVTSWLERALLWHAERMA
jgi:predicted dehydrogenase